MDPQKLPPFLRDLTMKNTSWIIYGLWGGGMLIHFLPLFAIALWFLKRSSAVGTIYASHFEWMMRTFVIGLAGALVMALFAMLDMTWILPLAGIPLGLWGLYRLIKGVLRLAENRAVENPHSLI